MVELCAIFVDARLNMMVRSEVVEQWSIYIYRCTRLPNKATPAEPDPFVLVALAKQHHSKKYLASPQRLLRAWSRHLLTNPVICIKVLYVVKIK